MRQTEVTLTSLLQYSVHLSPRVSASVHLPLPRPLQSPSPVSWRQPQSRLKRHDCSCCQKHTANVQAGVGKSDFFWSPQGLPVHRQAAPKLSSSETGGIKWVSIIRKTFHLPPWNPPTCHNGAARQHYGGNIKLGCFIWSAVVHREQLWRSIELLGNERRPALIHWLMFFWLLWLILLCRAGTAAPSLCGKICPVFGAGWRGKKERDSRDAGE